MRLPICIQRFIFRHICPDLYAGALTLSSQLKQSQDLARKAADVHTEAIHEVARLNGHLDQMQHRIDHLEMVNYSLHNAMFDTNNETIIPLENETFIVPSTN